MKIQLSDHFTTGKLLRFVAPSIVMMIFTSVYGVVDGLFVSNFVGKTAFAAVNLIFPLLMILGALGFMIGTGGSALVARTLGEGDSGRAQRYFSMLVYVTIGGGIVFFRAGAAVPAPHRRAFGRTGCHAGGLRRLRRNPAGGPDDVHAAKCVPELSHHSRKAPFWPGRYRGRGAYQYHTGLFVHRRVPLGRGGRCHCHGRQPVCGRRRTAAVFCPAQPQPFAAWKNEAGQPCIAESLHQWLVGADDQPLFFTGDSAVQFSAHAAGGGRTALPPMASSCTSTLFSLPFSSVIPSAARPWWDTIMERGTARS